MTRGLAAAALVAASLLAFAGCATVPAELPEPAVPTPPPPAEVTAEAERLSFPSVVVGSGDPESTFQPAPVAPTQVIVPSVGIDMTVTPEGVEDDGYMSIPDDIQTAGWYEFGSGPASEAGSTVIAAHVDDPVQGVGPFSRLRDVGVGSEARVIDADGTTHVYRVVSVERIAKAEVPLDQVFTLSGDPHLVLVTCGGAFDRAARSYTDNYIVTAEKVS